MRMGPSRLRVPLISSRSGRRLGPLHSSAASRTRRHHHTPLAPPRPPSPRSSQVEDYAGKMLGARLVTKQTGPGGQQCSKVLVNEGITIHRECYFAILMDRAHGGPVMVASTQGGMDIEEVAEKSPEAIITEPVDITKGLQDAQARNLAERLGFSGALADRAVAQFRALYNLFIATDATQVEINPLAEGSVPGRGEEHLIFAVDAKLNFDDAAAFRQADVYAQRDKSMEDARDVAAEEVRAGCPSVAYCMPAVARKGSRGGGGRSRHRTPRVPGSLCV